MPACPPNEDEIALPAPPPPEGVSSNHIPGKWNGPVDERGRPINAGRVKGGDSMKRQITHEALIDFMFANPRATLLEIAEAFGWKSRASVSIIMNSDAFQAAYARRQSQIVDPVVVASVEDRIKGLASRSAEILAEKLEQNPSDKMVMDIFKESTRAGSYGVKAPVAIQQQFVVALPGPASNSKEWLERFRPNQAGVVTPRMDEAPVEAEVKEVKNASTD